MQRTQYNSTRRPQSNFQMDCNELDNIINRYCMLNNVHMFIVLPVVVRQWRRTIYYNK